MARFIGDQNKVLFKYESGLYASASGTGQWLGLVQSNDLKENINVQDVRYTGNMSRDVGLYVDTVIDVQGKMKLFPQDWKSLVFAMGSCVDASGTGVPYTHTISAINSNVGNAFTSGVMNPFMSFTVEESVTVPGTGLNKVKTAVGCMIDTWELSWGQGKIAEINVDYIAQQVNYSSGAATAVTAIGSRPFTQGDFLLHVPSGTIIGELRDGSFKISNNLDAPHYTNGSKVIDAPIPGDRMYELSIQPDAVSERFKIWYDQYFRGGSTFNALLVQTCPEAGAGSRDNVITMSGCRITDMEDPSKTSGVNQHKIIIRPTTVVAVAHDTIVKYNPW